MTNNSSTQGRVAGKTAVVTGAASKPGLGRAIAQRMAAEGAKVVVTDIDEEGVNQCAEEIIAAGGEAIALVQDVSSESRWKEVMAETIKAYGKLDVMVNNAGIAILKPMADLTIDEWDLTIKVNLTSVFLGSKYAALEMRKTGGGSIINMSSVAGIIGNKTTVAYGASKGGVRAMSKAMGTEEAEHNIRCNTIHPGFIWTNMQAGASGLEDPSQMKLPREMVPLGRVGVPEDISNMALFLASDEADYITGSEFVVDAGMTAI